MYCTFRRNRQKVHQIFPKSFLSKSFLYCASFIYFLLVAFPSWSQTAGQIAPPSFRPSLQQPAPGALTLPETRSLVAPEGAERLSVRVGRLEIEGALPELSDATATITAPIEGNSVTAAAIFEAARAIEAAYARAGFVLARVVLPAQTLTDGGAVRLLLVNGTIGQVDTTALPANIRTHVGRFLTPLEGRPGLTLREIERRLLLGGDTPGTALRSTLAPGEAPGTTRLVVEAQQRPITGFVSYDNTLSEALGRSVLGFGLDLNSVLGMGELFYLRASGYPGRETFDNPPINRSLAAGMVWPLGHSGLSFNLEVAQTLATPWRVADAVNFTSEFQRYSARLRYPLLRGRAATLNLEAAFDLQSERLESITPVSTLLALDELRIARLSADGFRTLPGGGVLSGRMTLSQGLSAFGARQGTAEVPLSRQGAGPDFSKLEASVRLDQPLASRLALQVTLRGQTSFGQALVRSEQIGLVSGIGLSAFASGRVQGDSGYVARAELQSPWTMPAGSVLLGLAPYVFGSVGMVTLERPTALERSSAQATSYGVGVRVGVARQASSQGLTLSLEYGRGDRSDLNKTEDRVTVVTMLRF